MAHITFAVMSHFPVSSSILSASYLSSFVQQYYLPHEAVVHCRLLKSGINDTYLVRCSSATHVLRIYALGWRTPLAIDEELKVVNLLHDKGLPVSYPIANASGNYMQPIDAPEGERYCVLFTHAPGRKLQQYNAEMHRHIGILMARMHTITQGMELNRPDYTADTLLHTPLQHIGQFLPADSEEMQFLQRAQPRMLEELTNADVMLLRTGIVHLDIWFDNLNITEDGGVTLFDFDFCGNGFLALDVAYYMMQVHFTERDPQVCSQKVAAFLQGYESVTALAPGERQLLPALGVCLYFFYLGNQCYRFENWSNSFLNEAYLTGYVNRIIKPYYDKWFQ